MAEAPSTPNYGQVFTKGVKYIKINKLDKNGEDYEKRLAVADNIRINYPDVGSVQYNILTTQQQEDYYLMGVIPNENTSSINEILNYQFTASCNFSGSSPGQLVNDITAWSVTEDVQNYFNSSTGIYTFGNTPNIPLKITITGSFDTTGEGATALLLSYVVGDGNDAGTIVSYELVNNEVYTIPEFSFITTGSGLVTGSVLENIPHKISYITTNGYGTASLSWSIELVNPSSITTATETLINITPEVLNFEYSDYNAVFGNATIPQYSQKYQNVSYNTGLLSPTNIEYIRNGTAEKASVNDSNYSQKAWSNSRYNGNRISSYDFNVATINLNN